MDIQKASFLVNSNHLAIVIFTKGLLFTVDEFGNGSTGNWVINKEELENVDKVIIYKRGEGTSRNIVYIGNYVGVHHSPEPNRYIIRFSSLTEVGTTESTWNEFAGSGQNPVSYVGDFI